MNWSNVNVPFPTHAPGPSASLNVTGSQLSWMVTMTSASDATARASVPPSGTVVLGTSLTTDGAKGLALSDGDIVAAELQLIRDMSPTKMTSTRTNISCPSSSGPPEQECS